MRYFSELSKRYARALYEMVKENGNEPQVLGEIRALEKALIEVPESATILQSPLISTEEKKSVLDKMCESIKPSAELKDFLGLLAQKNRLSHFEEICAAYESVSDHSNGVVRGTVRSVYTLGPDERTQLEDKVEGVTGKKVILEYKEDADLIGGLVAEVGSYRFDDSLDTQIRLLNDELTRRAH